MQQRERVTILGSGGMATVCSILLVQNGHDVTMWGAFEASIERLLQDREQKRLLPGVRVPAQVRLTARESDALADATLILSAVPTQYMRSVWDRVKPHVPAGAAIVSVAKGIENGTLLRPTQIIADVLGHNVGRKQNDLAVLSGPNIAAEIARYLPATAVVACDDITVAQRIQAAVVTQWFRVYSHTDVIGVELAGATKNVIAIAAGILDGLGAGNNAKAALVTRGLVEITRLAIAMGAQAETFRGLAGLGDLITTCVSPEGRNRSVGEQIGKGRKLDDILQIDANGCRGRQPTVRGVAALARRYGVEMPITEEGAGNFCLRTKMRSAP